MANGRTRRKRHTRNDAKKSDPWFTTALNRIHRSFEREERDQAIQQLDQLIEQHPLSRLKNLELVTLYRLARHFNVTTRITEIANLLGENSFQVKLAKVYYLMEQKEHRQAQSIITSMLDAHKRLKLPKKGLYRNLHEAQGYLFMNTRGKQHADTINAFKEALSTVDNSTFIDRGQFRVLIHYALLIKDEKPSEAITYLTRLIDTDTHRPFPTQRAKAHHLLHLIYQNAGEEEKANLQARKTLEAESTYAAGLSAIAKLHEYNYSWGNSKKRAFFENARQANIGRFNNNHDPNRYNNYHAIRASLGLFETTDAPKAASMTPPSAANYNADFPTLSRANASSAASSPIGAPSKQDEAHPPRFWGKVKTTNQKLAAAKSHADLPPPPSLPASKKEASVVLAAKHPGRDAGPACQTNTAAKVASHHYRSRSAPPHCIGWLPEYICDGVLYKNENAEANMRALRLDSQPDTTVETQMPPRVGRRL
jgi:hypothetical protein